MSMLKHIQSTKNKNWGMYIQEKEIGQDTELDQRMNLKSVFLQTCFENTIGKQNQSYLTEFILLGFGNFLDLQPALFLFFLVVYMVTMTGNILIFVLVVANQHLHKLMYFFLGNLSCLKTCYTSTILPRFLASFLTGDRSISYSSCMTQKSISYGYRHSPWGIDEDPGQVPCCV
uniref:G-protein coupled receptors family 1 profile domain-containing protein n=1 Tax=Apteryx owenii TaxID=8824 RepID=A0A8B9S3D3_APTOW